METINNQKLEQILNRIYPEDVKLGNELIKNREESLEKYLSNLEKINKSVETLAEKIDLVIRDQTHSDPEVIIQMSIELITNNNEFMSNLFNFYGLAKRRKQNTTAGRVVYANIRYIQKILSDPDYTESEKEACLKQVNNLSCDNFWKKIEKNRKLTVVEIKVENLINTTIEHCMEYIGIKYPHINLHERFKMHIRH